MALTIEAWNSGEECETHGMSWCAICNPNANSYSKTGVTKAAAKAAADTKSDK